MLCTVATTTTYPPSWPQWPFDIACYTLLAIGVPLLIWAWWWDRPRGRHRCPKCWYNLAGLAIPADRTQPPCKCPECGREVRAVRETRRTRRRVGIGLIAVAAIFAAPILQRAPDARDRGWRGLVPTTPMLVAMQMGLLSPKDEAHDGSSSAWELLGRALDSATWSWQRRWAFNLLVPTYIWIRPVYPAGFPVAFEHNYDFAFPAFASAAPDDHAPPRPSHQRVWLDRIPRAPAQRPGRYTLSFKIDCYDGFKHAVQAPYEVGGSINDCIRPVTSVEMEQRVRAALTPRLLMYGQPDSITIDPTAEITRDPTRQHVDLDLTVALTISAKREGQLLATGHWMRPQNELSGFAASSQEPALLQGPPEALAALRAAIDSNDPAERARWTFTFTGDGELALSDVYSDAYWAGSFTMTLDELLAPPPSNTSAPASSKSNPNK